MQEIKGEPKIKKGKRTIPDDMLVNLTKEKDRSKDILKKVLGKVGKSEPIINARKAAALEERSKKAGKQGSGADFGGKGGKKRAAGGSSSGGPPKKKFKK